MLETTEEDGFKYFGKIVDLCKECYPLEFKVNGISGFWDKSRKEIAKSLLVVFGNRDGIFNFSDAS